ncbi:hypothetical protein BASA81_008443 [Batrachochytrium salamandrivorans]|nr:hypothetical protein BASA81_008443 [Batrachochytrium salamandrivorans]
MEEEFARPKEVEWDVFEEAVVKMTQHALDDEWAGDHSEDNAELTLDYLLANFAERWIQGRGTTADAVAEFLSDTIKDLFDVEVPTSICYPLAKLMATLHDECRNKVLVGVNVVLGEAVVQSFFEENRPLEKASAEAVAAVAAAGGEKEMEVEKEEEVVAPIPKVDADGWATVPAKSSSKKKKGKKFE